MITQGRFVVALAVWACMMYALLLVSVWHGQWLGAVLAVLLASPILLVVLAVTVEDRSLMNLISLSKQSWSFMIGDTFALTAAVAFSALARRSYTMPAWSTSPLWIVACAVIGLAAGLAFHIWLDGNGYRDVGAAALLNSPTKLAHDFVAYPVLFGGLVCTGVPLLFVRSGYTWAVLACVAVWGLLGVCDARRDLNPFNLHPRWNEKTFSSIR